LRKQDAFSIDGPNKKEIINGLLHQEVSGHPFAGSLMQRA
jgi:hypothetical protein